jgi:large subunit ribosomal protein L17
MRHRKKLSKLGRTASHRRATLASLSTSLLRHKRITTTVTKAKETRLVVEKMITRAKNAATAAKDKPAIAVHARREVGRMIKDRAVIKELFTTIADKVATRPGGYTRIVKLGQRKGDGAELAVIELVDFNMGQEISGKLETVKKVKAPRTRKAKADGAKKEAKEKSEEKAAAGAA